MAIVGVNEITGLSGQSRNTYANMLKYYYGALWDNWVHTNVKMAKRIAQKKGDIGGKEALFAVATGLPASSGISLTEGRTLPTPRAAGYINPEERTKDLYTSLQWTGQVERAARRGDKAAWARPRQKDVEDSRARFDLNFERKLFVGPYDILTVLLNNPTGGPLVNYTAKPRDSRTSGVTTPANWFNFGAFYLHDLQSIALVSQATPDQPAGAAVTGIGAGPAYDNRVATNEHFVAAGTIDVSNPTLQEAFAIDAALPVTANPSGGSTQGGVAGDLIVPWSSRKEVLGTVEMSNGGAGDSTAQQRLLGSYFTMNGIGNVCTGTTKYSALYGLLKSAQPKLLPIEDTFLESQRAWSEMLLTVDLARIRNEGSGRTASVVITGEAMIREIVKENRGDRRFSEVITNSGFGQLMYTAGDTQVAYEENWICPPGMVVPIHEKGWGYYEEDEMGPIDDQLVRFVTGQDAHQINFHKSGNVICSFPHANGIIDDLIFKQFTLS